MFKTISRLTTQYRYILLAAWVVGVVLITALAPNLDDIATNDNRDFLPADAPSIAGMRLLEEHFPDQVQEGNIVIAFDAGAGESVRSEENMAYLAAFSTWLNGAEAPAGITEVLSPTLLPPLADMFISADNQLAIISLSLSLNIEEDVVNLIEVLDERLADSPMRAYQTGRSPIFADYNAVILETVDKTLLVTLALVLIILLAIYRSPISPFIPLGVVTMAYLVARGIVAWLGQAEVFSVSGTAAMLLIVVMYGSGTDFCLFLINRFREELATRNDKTQAARSTIQHVGESITSSAGTTTVGFMAMATAQLGLFNTAGPTLAIGIVVSLLAGLTLTPSLLALLGHFTFFPGRATRQSTGSFYRQTSQLVSSRPLLTIIAIVAAMLPFAVYGMGKKATYNALADMPKHIESVEGFALIEKHLDAGNVQPLQVVVALDGDLDAESAALTQSLLALEGVADVRSASLPAGKAIQLPAIFGEGYLNRDSKAARFEVVLAANPYGEVAMDQIVPIRQVLGAASPEFALLGLTAQNADIRSYLQDDVLRTISLVLLGIFVILVVMLRSVVAPAYLIATILLSFGTTLGLTRIASQVIWGESEITWWVPFFLFVFLVALGIDYSIYLFGRIKEEVSRHGLQDGIHQAVQMTGSIITSAGIIVAGTFGAMMLGEIRGLAQIGFAVSVGILIDTFIVRTILDPALATLFGRWTWFPGGVPTLAEEPSEKILVHGLPDSAGAD